MSRDPVDRVLAQDADTTAKKPYDPILNPYPDADPAPAWAPYDPNAIFNGKDFGRPATGDDH